MNCVLEIVRVMIRYLNLDVRQKDTQENDSMVGSGYDLNKRSKICNLRLPIRWWDDPLE